MKHIKHISRIVIECLEEKAQTRNSDNLLYMAVCEKVNPVALRMPFNIVMGDPTAFGLPKFESVRRSRQKAQADREDLRACDEVTDERYNNWKAVREFVRE